MGRRPVVRNQKSPDTGAQSGRLDLDNPYAFHLAFPGYRPTPVVPLPSLSARIGRRVLAKDETRRLGLTSFKVLGASWLIAVSLARRMSASPPESPAALAALVAGRRWHLVAATEGNHGEAVAFIARMLSLPCTIFVSEGTPSVRRARLASLGARVVACGDYDVAVAEATAAAVAETDGVLVNDTSTPECPDAGRLVRAGYCTLAYECVEAWTQRSPRPPALLVVQVGVGELAAAVFVTARAAFGEGPLLATSEPEGSAGLLLSIGSGHLTSAPSEHPSTMQGLNCPSPSGSAYATLTRLVDMCCTVTDDEAAEAVALLERDGMLTMPAGAAGAAGLLRLKDEGILEDVPEGEALVVVTEGRLSA